MKLTVINSGSSGNCYLLKSKSGEVLILEAGVPFREVSKMLGYDLSGISGCLISHDHGDHAKYCYDISIHGVKCYVSEKTSLGWHTLNFHTFKNKEPFSIGSFQIMPFEAKHDVPCSGFLIFHKECGTICFLTDSYYSPYLFPKVNHYIIEANYCEDAVKNMPDFKSNRLYQSHLSIQTCKKILKANDTSKTKTVTLIHLSEYNSNEERFIQDIQGVVPGAKVNAARRGLVVDLNLIPF